MYYKFCKTFFVLFFVDIVLQFLEGCSFTSCSFLHSASELHRICWDIANVRNGTRVSRNFKILMSSLLEKNMNTNFKYLSSSGHWSCLSWPKIFPLVLIPTLTRVLLIFTFYVPYSILAFLTNLKTWAKVQFYHINPMSDGGGLIVPALLKTSSSSVSFDFCDPKT